MPKDEINLDTDTKELHIKEARRQIEICNACRYCEGYCSVFPALQKHKIFSDTKITQLANLCHNCRGCYYACQYTEPHEFELNLPSILSEVRQDSWEDFAVPQVLAKQFHRHGMMTLIVCVLAFAGLFYFAKFIGGQGLANGPQDQGFYQVMSHTMMVAIFLPAFLLPLLSISISLRRFWTSLGGVFSWRSFVSASWQVLILRDLSGGHGDGCNFEDEDRFSNSRRYAHQMVMYGFLFCFMSTSVATVLHYIFDMHAPYPFWSLPKLFGVTGGLMLGFGTLWMIWLKLKAERHLSDRRIWGGEMAFILLLCAISWSGLFLYWLGELAIMPVILAFHLGSVLTFFLLMPYTKMVHSFYRFTAIIKNKMDEI